MEASNREAESTENPSSQPLLQQRLHLVYLRIEQQARIHDVTQLGQTPRKVAALLLEGCLGKCVGGVQRVIGASARQAGHGQRRGCSCDGSTS